MKRTVLAVFRFFLITSSIVLVVAIIGTLLVTAYLLRFYSNENVDGIAALAGNNGEASKLYAVNEKGELVEYASGELSMGRSNDYALLDEIPLHLQNAFIAIEDKRFYSHVGFDPITTLKAAWKYVRNKKNTPGGSTITQQLIKNLTGEDDISVKRKLSEIMRAVKLERQMSKKDILELYLNSIYLSQGTYGVKAAARLYFDKDVSDLSLMESAAIAAITQAPTKWDPIQNPENNQERRDIILTEMLEQGYISKEEYDENYHGELTLRINREKTEIHTSSWYTDAVINEAITLLSEALDISEKAATQYLYNGGYRITVAVDTRVQALLEQYYRNDKLFSQNGVQSSFVIIEPQSGNVLALVGGLGEKNASRILNRATQTTRSPGSAIKPLSVFLPALEKGIIHYGSTFDDVPLYFGNGYPSSGWPENADKIYKGIINLEYAVEHSVNTAAVSILEKLGIENAYAYLETLGISTLKAQGDKNDMTLSAMALGGMTNGVSLLELTNAYTVLASNGIFTRARCVLEITDKNGHLIVDNKPEKQILAKEESVVTLTNLLKSVIQNPNGTAYGGITKLPELCDVAGKTGTTNQNNDRWFVGYTPYAVGGIWVGYDQPRSLSSVGSKEHLRVWDTVMSEVHAIIGGGKTAYSQNQILIDVSYCSVSGKMATEACYKDPRGSCVVVGQFTQSTIPQEPCDRHVLIGYCSEGQGIAGSACPHDTVETVGLLLVERSFPREIVITDAQYCIISLPEGYLPCISLTEPFFQNYIPDGVYIGKSDHYYPFNRFCSRHVPYFGA